jgi:tetraacyldisaccharide 4'-kinase
MYDHSLLHVQPSCIPVVSVGNISVGGTGKTPFTAWIAAELSRRGAQPAVVLRGYGGDEPLVHARLNPGIPVVIERHRADGVRRAAELGATVAVLDDAFQHRAASRSADIVLLAAEQWGAPVRLLPAGPWREPLASLRRASLAVITRKIADDSSVARLAEAIRDAAPLLPQAVARFTLGDLRRASEGSEGDTQPLAVLAGRPVTALAGVADADVFFRQLESAGALVTRFAYADHHDFSAADIAAVLGKIRGGDAMIICTLKDAVKLAPIWPATAPVLWYVSQALEVESGREALENLVVHAARRHSKVDLETPRASSNP